MSSYYVDSNAGGAGTGADWTNAFTTLTAAIAASAAGDTFYIAHNHAESTAGAVTLTAKGTSAAPCIFLCVNSGGSVPPVSADLSTTATITTTGANDLTISGINNGKNYWYGVNFHAGSTSTGSMRTLTTVTHVMYECSYNAAGTGGNIVFGGGAPHHILYNHDFGFAATSQSLAFSGGTLSVRGGTLIGAAVPTTLFSISGDGRYTFNGFDFSPKSSGTLTGASSTKSRVQLNNCKFGGSYTITTPSGVDHYFDINNSDSGDTNYRGERYMYSGTQTTQTSTLVRSGGASDGTTTISWKVVTTANATNYVPFICKRIVGQFNGTIGGALTATVEFLHDSLTNLQDDEIWMEIEHLGTSGFPISTFANDGLADVLATPADQTASSETWDTTGLTNPNKQKVSVSFTPQEKGVVVATVFIAKASYTVYVDPVLTVA